MSHGCIRGGYHTNHRSAVTRPEPGSAWLARVAALLQATTRPDELGSSRQRLGVEAMIHFLEAPPLTLESRAQSRAGVGNYSA